MLPEGWHQSTLGEIAKISSGGTPDRSNANYWGGSIPWITTGEIKFNKIVDSKEKITEEGLNSSSAKLFPPGTLLMAMYGQGKTRGQVAKLGIVAATNQACAAMVFDERHNPDFYLQYLSSQYIAIRELGNSGTQKNLNGSILKGLTVPAPPLWEQERIAELLATWDKAVERAGALIATGRLQKQALVAALTEGKVRRLSFRAPWRSFALGDLGETYGGLSGKTAEDFGQGLRFIPYLNIFTNPRVDTTTLARVRIGPAEKQSRVKRGDILFTTSSETPEEVGMASVLLEDVDELFLNSFSFGYRPYDSDTLLPEYAAYLLRAPTFRRQMIELAQGSTRFNISKVRVMRLRVELPSAEEQRAIVQVLDCAAAQEKLLSRSAANLRAEKAVLVEQLLSGKRRLLQSSEASPAPQP